MDELVGNSFGDLILFPVLIEYLFYSRFDVPLLKLKLMLKDHKARDISFSDHEAVMAQIHVWKK